MKLKSLTVIMGMFLLLSCNRNDLYFQYEKIPASGWSQDSAVTFDVEIADDSTAYNVYINVRNRGEYPHQNLWLFINQMSPDSTITSDTIDFYLADQYGKWLGSGIGSVYEMPVLYQQQVKFSQKGHYRFEIYQGMRDSLLTGLNNIGLRLEKAQ